jgi:hypothetical protein
MAPTQMVVGGNTVQPSANFTRPSDTTAYASGDLVANSTTAGSVVAMTFSPYLANRPFMSGCVRRARIHKSDTDVVNAAFKLHLFSASPGVANGDNGAFVPSVVTGWLGTISVTVGEAGTAGAVGIGAVDVGSEINFLIGGSSIYGLLEATAAYEPASAEVFTVTLDMYLD